MIGLVLVVLVEVGTGGVGGGTGCGFGDGTIRVDGDDATEDGFGNATDGDTVDGTTNLDDCLDV